MVMGEKVEGTVNRGVKWWEGLLVSSSAAQSSTNSKSSSAAATLRNVMPKAVDVVTVTQFTLIQFYAMLSVFATNVYYHRE